MDRTQQQSAKAEVSPESGLCDVCPSAAAPRRKSGGSLLTRLLAKLETEQYDRREHTGAYVDGWTDRSASLADWLRIEIALAELRACDVDGLFDHGGEA